MKYESYYTAMIDRERQQERLQAARDGWLYTEARHQAMLRLAEQVLEEKAKETEMALISVDAQVDQIIKQKQQEKEVNRRLAWIEEQGADDHPDGTIVRFDKKHGTKKQTYRYAALKAADFWYTTSGAGIASKYCWSDFLLWLSEDNPEPKLFVQQDVPTAEVNK